MGERSAARDISVRQRPRSNEVLLFARNFLRHPRMLGSIVPSSRFLIRELLEPIDFSRARVVVEYGPGVGTITAEILRRMRPDARLIVIETNSDFVQFLRNTFSDERLQVVAGSAADVDRILAQLGHEKASFIVSGIPFSTLPRPLREQILRKSREVLEPGGAFVLYQFSTKVLPDLKRTFRHVRRSFEPLNVLPAHLFYCQPDPA